MKKENLQKERDYADGADEHTRDERWEREEETYRDGTLINECWKSGGYTDRSKAALPGTKITEKKP